MSSLLVSFCLSLVCMEQVAEHLLEKEVLTRADMIQLIGERPFKEKTTYEEFLDGTGDEKDEKSMSLDEFMTRPEEVSESEESTESSEEQKKETSSESKST